MASLTARSSICLKRLILHNHVKKLGNCLSNNCKLFSSQLVHSRNLSTSYRLLDDTMFTESHEWVRFHGEGKCTVGITNHAQNELGDVVYVELPEVGAELDTDESFAVIESVKAASDINAPVGGIVTAINEALIDEPAIVNKHAEDDGWLIQLDCGDDVDKDHLLTEAGYKEHIGDES